MWKCNIRFLLHIIIYECTGNKINISKSQHFKSFIFWNIAFLKFGILELSILMCDFIKLLFKFQHLKHLKNMYYIILWQMSNTVGLVHNYIVLNCIQWNIFNWTNYPLYIYGLIWQQ